MAVTWLLLAAALTLCGGSRASGVRARRPVSLRQLQVLTGAACAVGCLGAFGPERGRVGAAVIVPVTVVAVTRLHAHPARARPAPAVALALDLVAVALRSGQPLANALLLAAPAAETAGAKLARVGGLLRLGAEPAEAWRAVAGEQVFAPIAAAACRSASSGVRLADTFERLAAELRSDLRAKAEARAQRAGTLVAAPLGLCFLPSFVCLGIVPVIVGIAGGVLAG